MQKGVLDDVAPRRRPVLDARQEAKALGFWRTAACRSGVWLVGSLVWAAGRCRELAVRRCGWPGCGPARARGPIGCSMISSPGLFVSAGGGEVTEAVAAPPGTSEFLGIGTRFFDDQARAACTAGVRQVVLLAAGLDCRAFRLDWPAGVRLFELDLPEVFAFKERVLASVRAAPRCARVLVAADLREQWPGALTAAGFDQTAATGWLAEGLLPYLHPTDSEQLLATVTAVSAPGSRVVFDYIEA